MNNALESFEILTLPEPNVAEQFEGELIKELKTCNHCKAEKPVCEFYKNRRECKVCGAAHSKKYRKDNAERYKELKRASDRRYYEKNSEELIKKVGARTEKNKDKVRIYQAEYREKNWDDLRAYQQREDIKAKNLKSKNRSYHEKNKHDPIWKLKHSLRSGTYRALKYGHKPAKTLEFLKCSVEDFKLHIEKQFTEGMTWENWGKLADHWNLDHILPINHFDFTNEGSWDKCFHYTNFQPLWWRDNLEKFDKLDWKPKNKRDKNGVD